MKTIIYPILCCSIFILFGCASKPPRPDAYVPNHLEPSIKFTSNSSNQVIDIAISASADSCKGFESKGYLFYDAQKRESGFLASIQKINPLAPAESVQQTLALPKNTRVQVKLRTSSTTEVAGRWVTTSCTAPTASFQTGENSKFEAFADFKNGCGLRLTDVTDVAAPKPVGDLKFTSCP